MPTTYAHYKFGQDVKKILPKTIQELIEKNINLFNIGLHGPDILFYYKPLSKNRINQIGAFLHENKAKDFFKHSIDVINSTSDQNMKNACLAYIYGFICHFTLDSSSHKYINKKTKEKNISHYEMEAEFDRILLVKDKYNPTSTKLTKHIVSDKFNSEIISKVFSNISPKEIKKTLKSMIFYLNILVAPSKLKRNLIYTVLKLGGHYNDMHGLIINKQGNNDCIETNNALIDIYNDRIKKAAILICNYTESLLVPDKLDCEFERTFEA